LPHKLGNKPTDLYRLERKIMTRETFESLTGHLYDVMQQGVVEFDVLEWLARNRYQTIKNQSVSTKEHGSDTVVQILEKTAKECEAVYNAARIPLKDSSEFEFLRLQAAANDAITDQQVEILLDTAIPPLLQDGFKEDDVLHWLSLWRKSATLDENRHEHKKASDGRLSDILQASARRLGMFFEQATIANNGKADEELFDASGYIQSIPGLIDTFRPVSDSVLLPLTKSFIRHLKHFDDPDQIVEHLDRSLAIAGWYREKFREPHYWMFIIEGIGLDDLTPSEPHDESDRFDALMTLDWEEIPEGLKKRLLAVGYDPEQIESTDDAALKKRIRKEWSAYHLPFIPSLERFSAEQLRGLVKIFAVPKAYPEFKQRIYTLLLQFRRY
jgi:hypothetical protein